ncbi:DUF4267 domain-containing protein [Nocardioides sp. LS1]|uniref:DUF4267 domain-containing protein n=1 Tax=Nocardioides sp. LS1 TaxID=1027620 RepID=UPI000FF93E52|nr:DUF4267 domain-containing protein [Nocardioides sp. LS1]GCD89136.1 hypothetical protein NLS1_11420 [Nocardioides sp. LS1]
MNPVTGLSLGRVAIGALALGNPQLAGKLFQLDVEANPQLALMSRLFGSREIALGALTLLSRGRARRALVLAGIAVDAADAAAGWLALQDGTVPKVTAAGVTAPAIGAVAAGLQGLRPSS